jgi:hypothetical protein
MVNPKAVTVNRPINFLVRPPLGGIGTIIDTRRLYSTYASPWAVTRSRSSGRMPMEMSPVVAIEQRRAEARRLRDGALRRRRDHVAA